MVSLPFGNPRHALQHAWLSRPDDLRRIDDLVRQRLTAAHRAAVTQGTVAARRTFPQSVEVLGEHVARGVRYGRWFVATASCALLGELIYSAERGAGKYGVRPNRPGLKDRTAVRDRLHRPLEALRNACFHPAAVAARREGVGQLVAALELAREAALAKHLDTDWARLHDAQLTAWAIAQIDQVGRYELGG